MTDPQRFDGDPVNEGAAPSLSCPVCRSSDFDQEAGKLDSQWGFTAHQVAMLICRGCGYVLLFDRGRSIFDFD